ncbi:MAG: outer membrane protein assembly factor BamA [Rhodothermales bacterium]|jgi:outer membrane protein assembly factor BamA
MRIVNRSTIYICLVAIGVLNACGLGTLVAGAQTLPMGSAPPGWTYVVQPDPAAAADSARVQPWPAGVSPGNLSDLISHLQRGGYYQARVDSTVVTETGRAAYVDLGDLIPVRVWVAGPGQSDAVDPGGLIGQRVTAAAMDSLTAHILEEIESRGRIGASIRVDSFLVEPGTIGIRLAVTEGVQATLLGLLVAGQTRASTRFLERVTGLRPGVILGSFDASALRARLTDTGLFSRVEIPLLLPAGDSTAIIQIGVSDRAPGSFDLALGYLPATGSGSGTIVGSGTLELRNVFGGGRRLSVDLDRLPGQSSSLLAEAEDPFVLGQNLGAEVAFAGYQQDSTFSSQEYRIGASLRLGAASVTASATRSATRPGSAGLGFDDGSQRVPDSRTRMAGFGLRLSALDSRVNPRRGYEVDIQVLRGRKNRVAREIVAATGEEMDTLRVERGVLQDRLEGTLRWHQPLGRTLSVASGLDFRALVSDVVDVSDLFRLGGATSLRGYDEDRFRGQVVGRALLEVRRLLDATSYTYAFFDLGLVSNPRLLIPQTDKTAWYPGYGLGIQLQTAAGIINVSYAMNTEEGPRNGRIHLGLAFGL